VVTALLSAADFGAALTWCHCSCQLIVPARVDPVDGLADLAFTQVGEEVIEDLPALADRDATTT